MKLLSSMLPQQQNYAPQRPMSLKWTRALVLSAAVCTLGGCLSSPDPEASYPLEVPEDKVYLEAYLKVSDDYEVIHNFETKYQVHVTHLTPEFRQAMGVRYQHIFRENEPSLAEAGQKTGFFVSIYSANRELADIANKQLWKIALEAGGRKLQPATIQRLSPKERWKPFFPAINPWSQDFLILFDQPPRAGEGKQGLTLSLNSPDGGIRSEW